MILYPAIDLKDGVCVRLRRGIMEDATVYNDDPAAQAAHFKALGFSWLHIVDLNGAFAGRPVNADAVSAILGATDLPVQLGGGIRDLQTIQRWMDRGVARVVLGTVALRDPDLVRTAAREFPGRVAVGIDAKGGKVAVEGWAEVSEMTAVDLAKTFEDDGVTAIIHTDIDRDGVLEGVNVAATLAVAAAVAIPVIASGGVATVDDVVALKANEGRGIAGAIIGRALYEGTLEPTDALAAAA
ncbi:MAG: 1-(5-phosphoribosyl)-5-[(5-phosphoribosylamino)methylideneamino]imidazole-4-carboxamide isomerase [Alphaproteobacteria bacterium]|nr:1-(5-phosphoribosyl)-5-[(5-phosphoribosylamino)methylideneamino]imidazole-4-carboxamide isomerase [Alphaproteobacteria bacterium]